MKYCTGNCDQGRKPCDCPLDADHGDFVSPWVKFLENVLTLMILLIAVGGITILFIDGGFL